MKSFLRNCLLLVCGIFFSTCAPEEEPSPTPSPTDIETQLNHFWDLYAYHKETFPDSAIFFMKKAKKLAATHGRDTWLASSYWAIAYTQEKQGYMGEAAFHFLKAAEMFKKTGEISRLGNAYTGIGDIYAKAQDYETAASYFQQAKEIFLYEGTNIQKAKVFRNLAVCFMELNNYEDAENMLNLAMEAAETTEGYAMKSLIYNMKGLIRFEQKEYKEARKFYSLTIEQIDETMDSLEVKASAYNNIGKAYLFEGNYTLAEEWLNKALKIKNEIGDPTFTQSTINTIGKLRIEQEQHEAAIDFLEQGLTNLAHGTIDPAVEEGLALMMEALVKTNAKGTPAQYAHLNRQLATYSQKLMAYNSKLSGLKQQLETTSKQQALQLALEKHTLGNKLEAAEEKNKQIQYAFIIPILLLIAASVSVYLAIRRNRNAKQLINAIDDVLNKRHQNMIR